MIEKMLAHINAQVLQPEAAALPPFRAPPQLKIGDDWLQIRSYLALPFFATFGMVLCGCLCRGLR